MGGSQGAKSIDNAFGEIIKELAENNNLQIVFQTGKKNFSDVTDRLEKIYPNYKKNKSIIIAPNICSIIVGGVGPAPHLYTYQVCDP